MTECPKCGSQNVRIKDGLPIAISKHEIIDLDLKQYKCENCKFWWNKYE